MTPTFERGGCVVSTARRLAQVLGRKPAGVTGGQWSAAAGATVDFLVEGCDVEGRDGRFAVLFGDLPATAPRVDRLVTAVCDAADLPLLRIASPTLRPDAHGRRVVEYVLDARAFPYPGYRDIVGRLPDGRTGAVNDLGAVARAAAVEAYVARQLADPIVRCLRVRFSAGPAEGWAWLEVRPGGYVFERVRVEEHRAACGLEPERLAEDLAVAAVGERLKQRHATPPVLVDRAALDAQLDRLRAQRAELVDGFVLDQFEERSGQPAAR